MSYVESNQNWVHRNSIAIGSTVKVIKACHSYDHGWQGLWVFEMNKFVGKSFKVIDIRDKWGVYLQMDRLSFWFPYFVLEPIEANQLERREEPLSIPLEIK